ELQKFLQVVFKDDYHISIAADGIEAWQMIEQQQPDLVISDIMMPNMDGVELCKLIKSTFATAHIPVILLTALIDKSKEREALGLGADDYITKPFDISILQSRIESIITNRKIVREKAMHFTENKDSGNAIVNNKLNDQFIRKALDVVNANMEKTDFGKEAFASEMGVSSSLLYKKTKALTGLSPSEFIKSVRMSYAYNLLQSHEYSVTEISEKVGFSNLSAFSRAFKLHSGKNPTEI
ncbi:MAG: response regulator, partial [Raoultella planticola]